MSNVEDGEDTRTNEAMILDPHLYIIDPHIHLWRRETTGPYWVPELARDLDAGHNVAKAVYVECGERYLSHGPDHLRSVGESVFVTETAEFESRIAGLICKVDLSLGFGIQSTLDAHIEAAGGLLKGARHAAAFDPNRSALQNPGSARPGLLSSDAARDAMIALFRNKLVNDHWIFFHQIDDLSALIRTAPETTIVLNHLGTPLGVGPYRADAASVWNSWRGALSRLAEHPNVFVKLGGLGMPDVGLGWGLAPSEIHYERVSERWKPWIEATIEIFGVERCMFESNSPVDCVSVPYSALWNAFKHMTRNYSVSERKSLFSATARRVYQL